MEVKPKNKRSYGGVSSEARDKLRRESLIVAGIDGFGTSGYAATTIESLCSAARVSTRDFYNYFATKEDLMLGVYDHISAESMQRVGRAVAQATQNDADARGTIRAGIGEFAHSMSDDERWGRINFIEIVGISTRVESRRREVIRGFGELVAAVSDALATRGEIDRDALPPVHSVAMVGAVHETLTDWSISDERAPLDEIIEALVDIFAAVFTAGSESGASDS